VLHEAQKTAHDEF
jgi:hypothetical protein